MTATGTATLEVSPLTPGIGARVSGVDLAAGIDAPAAERLNAALLEHLVLVFPGQTLTPQAYRDALCAFGEPMRQHRERFQLPQCPDVSRVVNRDGQRPASMWHTDHTNHECPPKVTVLHAVALPTRGGDTWFANMTAGLAALPGPLRERLRGLRTWNAMEAGPSYSETDRARHEGGVEHPMVRTHPETGREALYFHATKSQRIAGMEDAQVRAFLEALLEQAIGPDRVYRHRWQPGDVVMVDNRCTMHRVEADFDPAEHRELWRVILRGDRPH